MSSMIKFSGREILQPEKQINVNKHFLSLFATAAGENNFNRCQSEKRKQLYRCQSEKLNDQKIWISKRRY